MSRRLELAWNTSDAQTLAWFADNARVSTAWGQVWDGRSELSRFLDSFFYQGTDIPARPLQTLAQCEDAHTVIWTFRYPSGVNAGMVFTLEHNQVVKLYWGILPYAFDTSQSDSPGSLPGSGAAASSAVEACAIALAGSGLMYLVLLSERQRRVTHVSGQLLSALMIGVESARTRRSRDFCVHVECACVGQRTLRDEA
jgi:hypothetical protein